MNNNTVVGIDLAKSVFQVATLRDNKINSNKRFSRAKLKEFLCNSESASIFMGACYSAHYWARFAQEANHDVGLIPAQHVSPFTRGNKNDANDAVAIIEASRRPNLRLVRVRCLEQQDIQSLHRIRERLVRNRTGMINQTHSLLAEYGVVLSKSHKTFLLGVIRNNLGGIHVCPKQSLVKLGSFAFWPSNNSRSKSIRHVGFCKAWSK